MFGVFLIFHFLFGKFSKLQKRQKYKERHACALHPPRPLLIRHPVCFIICELALISFNMRAYIIHNEFLPGHLWMWYTERGSFHINTLICISSTRDAFWHSNGMAVDASEFNISTSLYHLFYNFGNFPWEQDPVSNQVLLSVPGSL